MGQFGERGHTVARLAGTVLIGCGIAAAGLVTKACPAAAQPWLDVPSARMLDQIARRMEGPPIRGGLDLSSLSLGIGGGTLDLGRMDPARLPRAEAPLRLFASGRARWADGRLGTQGLAAGIERATARGGLTGLAVAYGNETGVAGGGAESAVVAVYGVRTIRRGPARGTRVHAMAGVGRADLDGPGRPGQPLRFAEVGGTWRLPGPAGLTLAPDLRLGMAAGPGLDGTGTVATGARAALTATGSWPTGAGRLDLRVAGAVRAMLDAERGDDGPLPPTRARPPVKVGGKAPQRPDQGVRLCLTLTRPSGRVLTLEVTRQDPEYRTAGHQVRVGWSGRF